MRLEVNNVSLEKYDKTHSVVSELGGVNDYNPKDRDYARIRNTYTQIHAEVLMKLYIVTKYLCLLNEKT